jgi:hypothetical protein
MSPGDWSDVQQLVVVAVHRIPVVAHRGYLWAEELRSWQRVIIWRNQRNQGVAKRADIFCNSNFAAGDKGELEFRAKQGTFL